VYEAGSNFSRKHARELLPPFKLPPLPPLCRHNHLTAAAAELQAKNAQREILCR
jgi:hypothetical protein